MKISKDTPYQRITACGECCDGCPKFLDGRCRGCIDADGVVPEWSDSGRCVVHACTREHGVRFCGECPAFPCPDITKKIHWKPDVVEQMRALAAQFEKQRG